MCLVPFTCLLSSSITNYFSPQFLLSFDQGVSEFDVSLKFVESHSNK